MSDTAKRVIWPSQSMDAATAERIRRKSDAMDRLPIHGIHPDVAAIVHDEIGRYKVGGPMPITFDLSPYTGQVTVILRTVDRDNPGKRIEFSKSESILVWLRLGVGLECPTGISDGHKAALRGAVRDLLYRLARDAYLHELGEWFTRDGVRVRDPHADDPHVDGEP